MQHARGFVKIVDDAKTRIREISVEETRQKLESGTPFYFVDVREDQEWSRGHAQGAIHLGRGILERDIEGKVADLQAEIVLYCGGGYRSALAADNLQLMGYRNVFSMAGGFKEWFAKGNPVTCE
jgi:rhodanese-related sulfurtransferase